MIENWANFNWIDWSIISVLTVSTLLSLWRGFAREALSLLGWVAAFILANMFADRMAVFLVDLIDNSVARDVAAFAIIFVGILMISNVLGLLMKQLIRLTGLSVLDRMLGTVFGFARGVIMLLVIVFFVRELTSPESQKMLDQSQLLPHLDILMQWAKSTFGDMNITNALSGNKLPDISI